jgi:hypothetical protein
MSGLLPVRNEEDLALDNAAFNDDGLVPLFINGGRYGGDWNMAASLNADAGSCGSFWVMRPGSVSTADPRYPDMVIETAFGWLLAQARTRGWRVLSWENLNSEYGPAERPYFVLAQAVLGNERFEPLTGVLYADEADK